MSGVLRFFSAALLIVLIVLFPALSNPVSAQSPFTGIQSSSSETKSSTSTSSAPVELTADNLEYDQVREVYVATDSVVVVQGPVRLTADHVTFHKLSGELIAKGHVYLRDNTSDLWTEQLTLNLNTEAGVITKGKIFLRERNSLVIGKKIQRYSESHYRVKEGSFTNCDAKDGEIPAWRFTFKDIDFDWDDSLYGDGVWFNINDVPVLPFPTFRYPLGSQRKSGFLIPTVGIDNVFGFRYRHEYFWAIDPSQDLTVAPLILTNRGAGGDLQYRYALNRQAQGEWLMSSIYDTDESRFRAEFRGAHIQQVNPDLSVRAQLNYATDRTFLDDFSNSGVFRALPSQESSLLVNQRLTHGSLSFLAQYLQPLNNGSTSTFQRIPEIGHRFVNYPIGGTPFIVGMDSTFVHFAREQGFQVSRMDLLPSISTQGLHLGHIVGINPQLKLREVAYTRGETSDQVQHRETLWAAFEAFSRLSRRYRLGETSRIRHSIIPKVIYEFVPGTDQSKFVQVDGVDDLIEKNLLTYSLSTRISELSSGGGNSTWLDVFLAQSYHVDKIPSLAERLSNIWTRAKMNIPVRATPYISALQFSVDSFIDPRNAELRQFNADAQIQSGNQWYFQISQRFAGSGPQTRRGDIWNSISFNEVVTPQDKIEFLTATGAVRLPLGVTVGSRIYHDFKTGQTSEWDLVGVYQNPCRCFSLGLYYIQFPDRQQYNFLFNLTGLGGTQGLGGQLMRSILGPIMEGERGVPWSSL